MGAIGGLMGTSGGANGSGFSAPQQADIGQGTTSQDVINAQTRTAQANAAQRNLLGALQSQKGLQQQNALANQLGQANGVGTQNQAISGLQGVAGQYQNIASGQGPNPAQAMLNQQTGQNVANQAALMAGQRGAGANAGLLARQAAQQGAATQQQAVGQGATMQANQSLAGLAGLAGAQQAIGGLGTTQAAQQGAMANQIAGQQIGQVNNNAAAQLANQTSMQNSLGNYNSQVVSGQSNVNAANAGLAQTNMQGQQAVTGGIMNSIGGAASMPGGKAYGGEIKKMAEGGDPMATQAPSVPATAPEAPIYPAGTPQLSEPSGAPSINPNVSMQGAADPNRIVQPDSGAQSSFGQLVNSSQASDKPQAPTAAASTVNPAQQGYGSKKLEEGTEALASSGQKALSSAMNSGSSMMGGSSGGGGGGMGSMAMLAMAAKGGLASDGGHVNAKAPAQKAVASGDDYSNDKIPAKLSEGEIVLPRSVTMSADPIKAASEFVAKTLAERKSIPKKNYAEGTPDGTVVQTDQDYKDLPGPTPEQAAATPPETDQGAPADTAEQAQPNAEAAPPPAPNQAPGPGQPQGNTVNPNNPDLSEIIKYNQDVAQGKIPAESLGDLFAKKSTMGKIGAVFGLMLSGAGSGLAHQSNAALDVMKDQLHRDLELQKTGGSELRNFYNTVQDVRGKNITNARNRAAGAKEAAIAGKVVNKAGDQNQVFNDYLEQTGTDQKTLAHMMPAAWAQLKEKWKNNPTALAHLQALEPFIQQESINAYAKGQQAHDAGDKFSQQNNQGPKSKVIDEDAIDKLVDKDNQFTDPAEARQAGYIPFSDGQAIKNELVSTKQIEQDQDDYHGVWNELKDKPFGGENQLASVLTQYFSGNAKAGEALESMLSRPRQQALHRLKEKYGDMGAYFPGAADLNSQRKLKTLASGDKFFNQLKDKSHPVTNNYPDLLLKQKPKKSSGAKSTGKAVNPKSADEEKEPSYWEELGGNLKKAGKAALWMD